MQAQASMRLPRPRLLVRHPNKNGWSSRTEVLPDDMTDLLLAMK
jgi:hypothetical protein